MTTITVTGLRAAAIEAANHASFYGIKKSFGDLSEIIPGRIAAEDSVREYLNGNGIEYNSFWIIKARTIDTTGAKTPYKAEIDFSYD
jgi:hypothetical protein